MPANGWRKRQIMAEYSGFGGGGGENIRQVTDTEVMIAYLLLKVKQKDWHGVADAANDIREMEAREKKDDGRLLDRLAANKGAYEMEVEYNKTKAMEKKPWAGLTDEEAMQTWEGIIKYAPSEMRIKDFAHAIEAKLREKNG
jgi:hypothetical protein